MINLYFMNSRASTDILHTKAATSMFSKMALTIFVAFFEDSLMKTMFVLTSIFLC